MNNEAILLEALKDVVKLYIELVESGDAGYWNPHEEKSIKKAEELIAKYEQSE